MKIKYKQSKNGHNNNSYQT